MPESAPSPVSPQSAPAWPWMAASVFLLGLLVTYPPFHVGSRQSARQASVTAAAGTFDAVAFGEKFWVEQLQPAATRAMAVTPILATLPRDPAAAARQFGRRVGLGGVAYYFARGTGRVIRVERSRLLVEVDGVLVAIRTGPVFGNIVRDGCGQLEVNQVPGLAEFNALSAELNGLVEHRVQPSLRAGVAVGATLVFAGCAEAPESLPAAGEPLLSFIPLQAEVKP